MSETHNPQPPDTRDIIVTPPPQITQYELDVIIDHHRDLLLAHLGEEASRTYSGTSATMRAVHAEERLNAFGAQDALRKIAEQVAEWNEDPSCGMCNDEVTRQLDADPQFAAAMDAYNAKKFAKKGSEQKPELDWE